MKAFVIVLICALCKMAPAYSQQTTHKFNRDSQVYITKARFDQLVDSCTVWLQTKKLSDIPDSGHIKIMMCLNTIGLSHDSIFHTRFSFGRYEKLGQAAEKCRYMTEIINVYKEWIPNRGMRYYFPKLHMEVYGTPMLYAWFQVK